MNQKAPRKRLRKEGYSEKVKKEVFKVISIVEKLKNIRDII
jgi:hypothetical protein